MKTLIFYLSVILIFAACQKEEVESLKSAQLSNDTLSIKVINRCTKYIISGNKNGVVGVTVYFKNDLTNSPIDDYINPESLKKVYTEGGIYMGMPYNSERIVLTKCTKFQIRILIYNKTKSTDWMDSSIKKYVITDDIVFVN